jgi:hypothetical protein
MILMNKPLQLLFLLFFCLPGMTLGMRSASDTITVRAHNKAHMNWYGNYDVMAHFPDSSTDFKKVTLKYTLGCPSGGCSDWDYTMRVFVRHRTGKQDTTVIMHPKFRVDGNVIDTAYLSTVATYTYFFNTTKAAIDSTLRNPVKVLFYTDSLHPASATDSANYYPAGFYKPVYTSNGNISDSVWINGDLEIYLQYWEQLIITDVIEDIEMARYITPYSGNLKTSFLRTWEMDVTDYISLLRDSAEIRVLYDGWSDGFTVTLDFEMIRGIPLRKAYKVVQLYNGFFPYGDPNNSIENYLKPVSLPIDMNAKTVRLRTLQTGHGFGGNEDCAEFCPKFNYVKIDGIQRHSNLIWKDDCGMNPMSPQPGTWLYDRANWCPGEIVRPFYNEIGAFVTPGSTSTIDLDMTPFTNNGNNNCGYYVSTQAIFYEERNIHTDVELTDIIAPNYQWPYTRYNPVCGVPVIRVRNNGTGDIQQLLITYSETGGTAQTMTWNGLIQAGASMEIELYPIDLQGITSFFEVSIALPSGLSDQDASNNSLSSRFQIPPVYAERVVLEFKTNNAAAENSWEISNMNGQVLYTGAGFANNKIYRDTLFLADGCYRFRFDDSGKDGISFFANSAGSGYLRIKGTDGLLLKTFTPDFGTRILHDFHTSKLAGISQEQAMRKPSLFPNPGQGEVFLTFPGLENADISVRITDMMGKTVLKESFPKPGLDKISIRIPGAADGIYMAEIQINGIHYHEKILINQIR